MKSNNTLRVKALFLLAVYGIQLSLPALSFSSGNNSRSMESNGPAGGSEMVNLYTGDFSYSIPLMSVDGFPISLSYSSNIGMHQEASWVGLGWSLNTGAINRDKRGIPDDFDGDVITKITSSANDSYASLEAGAGASLSIFNFGKSPFNLFAGVGVELKEGGIYHDYLGFGKLFDMGITANIYQRVKGAFNAGLEARTGIRINGLMGITTSAALGVGNGNDPNSKRDLGFNAAYGKGVINNSRQEKMFFDYFNTSLSIYKISPGYGATLRRSGLKDFTPNIQSNANISGYSNRISLGYIYVTGSLALTTYGLLETAESHQIPNSQTVSAKSYGYLNLESAQPLDGDITDHNRENSHVINSSMEILPTSQLTYDLFYIQTPVSGASFRAFRNDIGTVNSQKYSASGSMTTSNVFGAAGSNTIIVSVGKGKNKPNAESSIWNNTSGDNYQNEANDFLSFQNGSNYDELSNTFYYKVTGELSRLNTSFFDQYGGFSNPSYIPVSTTSDGRGKSTNNLVTKPCTSCPEASQVLPVVNINTGKKMYQTQIQALTSKQSSEVGMESSIKSYSANSLPQGNFTITNNSRITPVKKQHHTSEHIVTDASGAKQIFNIPVYSIQEKSVVFNNSNASIDGRKQATYTAGTDNSTSNNKGLDKLYSATIIPGYATSYLLRAMLSSDYYDRTNNGLTEDDYGSYIKINHTCIYDESNPFKWRSPYSSGTPGSGGFPKAMFVDNLKSYSDDNYAAYEYGSKELWYTHSIEGKEHIALFYLDNRDDMFSVLGEDGGMDLTKPGKLLKKIVLFSKEDLVKHGANAEPLQTVEFIYDYSLCKGFDGNKNSASLDNTSGKLTLKKIFVNTSRSKEGQESKFEFVYNEGNFNYNPIHTDRWGGYNNTSFAGMDNFDFPYVDQSLPSNHSSFSAWNLTEIILPGGGKIAVEYESDDYAFVEDHSSMLFTSVTKMGHVNEKSAHATLANSNFAKDPTSKKPHNVVYFRLPEEITAATLAEGKDKLYDRYLKPIYEEHDGKLYYRYLVKIHDDSGSPEEWITGYCQIAMGANPQDSYGLIGSSPYQQAWITLQDVPVQEDVNNSYSTNPIMNQAWQFMRLSAPRNLFGNNVLSGTSVLNGIDIPSMVKAMNKVLYNKKICRSFIPEKSCIRIGAGGKKKGGGSRVKKILFYDQFNAMTGNKEIGSVYGMEYEYKSKTGESSGVASYEPIIGNDENPLKKGEEYVVERDKLPDEKLYHFSPIGEQFYEGAQVGYSEVKVKSIEYSGVERNATGYTIHNFYTSKDAPVINRKTAITTIPIEQGKTVIDGIFMRERVSTATMSQGFLIRKVHLAGKPEKVTSYSNNGAEIGSTNFEYTSSVPLRVVNNDGTHELAFMNREVDFFADAYSTLITNDNKSLQIGGGLKNYKPFVSVFASVNKSIEGYYFSTFTKVIEDYPILEKVTSHFQGAKTSSENIAWDALTGEVLVTKSLNDHNQNIYSVEYPSHWAYSNAKPKYLTADNHAENITITSGVANLSGTGYSATDLINVGDQIMITNSSGVNSLAWASYVSGSTVTLVDRTGTKLTTTSSNNTLRVLTPNTKADPSTPMMSYITLNNPIGVSSLNAPTGILSAGALSMKDCWETVSAYNFGCTPSSSECGFTEGTAINPWVTGVSGNLRPNLFYTYQVDRLENSVSVTPEVDLRSGGKYNSFIPFYAYSSGAGKYVPINNPSHPNYNAGSLEKWLIASQIIHYNEHGVPIESKDVLGNYSGVIFGYSNTLKILPVASAEFARYTDIASDGFEDYLFRSDLANCPNLDGHFDFKKVVSVSDLSSTEYHTGRFSLKIASGANFTVNRKLYSVSDEIPCSTPQEGKGEYSASSGQNLKGFSPKTGLYQFSIWAKQNTTNLYTAVPDAKIEIKVSYPGIDSITTLSAVESPIIEGWQKIEGTFRVSTNATCITVKLFHSATTAGNVFFDDLRIHPHNSNMIAVVYDPFTLRSWAVLDDRNYATIYEYDENGMVVRVKRETIDGIKTIAESRKSLKK